MTIDDARRELGVESGARPDDVRRAYLRLVKTRKPDVDPDGFQRLREAYELAARFASRTNRPPPVAMPDQAAAAASPPPNVTPETQAPLTTVSPRPPHPLQPFPAMASIARLEKTGDLLGAAKLMIEAIDAASASLDSPIPGLFSVLRVELRLFEQGEVATARALDAALRRWLDLTGNEARMVANALAATLQIARGLASLPVDFDPEVRAIIARAAANSNTELAVEELKTLRVRSPWRMWRSTKQLQRYAPAIATMFKRRRRVGSRGFKIQHPLYVVFYVFAMLAFSMASSFPREWKRPPAPPPTQALSLEQALDTLDTDALKLNAQDVEVATRAFEAALATRDCESARALWAPLASAVAGADAGVLRRDLHAVSPGAASRCVYDGGTR